MALFIGNRCQQKDLQSFCKELESNFEKAREKAITRIKKIHSKSGSMDKLMSMAQAAIVADEKINEAEEQMMAYICQTLGISPDKYLAQQI